MRVVLIAWAAAVVSGCGMFAGKPVLQEKEPVVAVPAPCEPVLSLNAIATPDTIKEIQARLIVLGFDTGPVDGVLGEKTRIAIRAYQAQHRLLADGLPTPELATHLRSTQQQALH
ncbi:MAG: peptidoglycan-binding protein [Gammaproteobacteria bacterium]|nr:peptidoglycan-binding protein [Gammaproteobacteria bacterium]